MIPEDPPTPADEEDQLERFKRLEEKVELEADYYEEGTSNE